MTDLRRRERPRGLRRRQFRPPAARRARNVAKWDGTSWSASATGFARRCRNSPSSTTGTAPRSTPRGTSRPPPAGSTTSRSGTAPRGSRCSRGERRMSSARSSTTRARARRCTSVGSFTSGLGTFSNRVVSLVAADSGGCNPADLAEPFGVLDLADVQAFIAAFTSGDPAADLVPPAGRARPRRPAGVRGRVHGRLPVTRAPRRMPIRVDS
jgi:hypothetical protein